MTNYTLLLTGTINPKRFEVAETEKQHMNVIVVDAEDRLLQYNNAIEYYLKETEFSNIVFVENSGYHFDAQKYEIMATEKGKKFEFIYRKLDDIMISQMLTKGKSWGEIDLINYALKNSRLLRETKIFYKATGRLTLKNPEQILEKPNDKNFNKTEFISLNEKQWVNTFFFKMDKDIYMSVLFDTLNEVDDYSEAYMEQVWYKKLKENKVNVKSFRRWPQVSGKRGASPGDYDKSKLSVMLRNIAIIVFDYFKLR